MLAKHFDSAGVPGAGGPRRAVLREFGAIALRTLAAAVSRKWSFRSQLLVLVFAALVPALGATVYGIHYAVRQSFDSATGNVQILADATADRLANLVRGYETLIARLADRPLVRALDAQGCDPLVPDFLHLNPEFVGAVVRTVPGERICSYIPGSTSPESPALQREVLRLPWFREGIGSGRFTLGDASFGRISGHWMSMLTYPVRDADGNAAGIVILGLDLNKLRQRVLTAVPEAAVISVIDRENRLLMRSLDPEKWIGKEAGSLELTRRARREGAGTVSAQGIDGIARVYGYRTVPGTGWLVVAGIPEDLVYAGHRERLRNGLALGLAALLLALALAWRIGKSISGPIRDLERTARAVADGDTAARATQSGSAEVETVAREFNRMLAARERASAELRESERRYRDMLGSVDLASVMLDREGRITYCNDFLLQVTGWQREELLGPNGFERLVPPEQRGEFAGLIQRMREGEYTPRHLELEILTKSGARRLIHWNHSVLRHPDGGFSGTASIGEDITERKRTGALLDAERKALKMIARGATLREILDTVTRDVEALSPGMLCSVLLLDADRIHLRHGAAPSLPEAYCQAIDGTAIGPAAGSCGTAAFRKSPVIVTDIDADPLWKDCRELALGHGLRACWSTPVLAADGGVLGTFAMYYREPRDPVPWDLELIDRCTQSIAIAIEQNRIEEALLRSEAQFRSIVEMAEEGVWMINEDAAVTFVNRKMGEIFGYAPEEMIGRAICDFMFENDLPAARAGQQRWREGIREQTEVRYRRKDGSEIWALVSCTPIFDSEHRFVGTQGMLSDITERRRAEQELRESGEYLRSLSRRLVRVQETERHELARELHDRVGQNLTALAINLDILCSGGAPGERARRLGDSLKLVEATAQAIHTTITELRPPMLDDYGLAAALRWYGGLFQGRTDVLVTVNGPDEAAPTPRPERDLALFRIAQEALNNVAKHAHARHVEIVLREQAGGAMLAVRDDGRGFDPVPSAQSEASFGMCVMRERVMAIGGSMTVESAIGRGTTLTVRVPS